MGILGGLDVGFGANMQIVRTNILVVDDTGAQSTSTELKNFLSLYNRVQMEYARGNNGLCADYICSVLGPSDTTDDHKVVTGTAGSIGDFPVIGQANPDSNSDSNHGVIAVLAAGAGVFDADLDVLTAVAGAADTNTTDMNGELLADLAGQSAAAGATAGVVKTANLGNLEADLVALLTGAADLDGLASFVEKGNAASTTPTELSDLSIAASSIGLMSVVALVGAGFM
jgi:hypothetical protein